MKKVSSLLKHNFSNSFMSVEKDLESIWRKLFVEAGPYSEKLKRLLIIDAPDCLDESQKQYDNILKEASLHYLKENGYIRNIPKLSFGEHEKVKAYLILEFDDFLPTDNPQYRDCVISITVMCHIDYWDLDDYKLRPYQIAGYVDGLLNESRLSGIGTLEFLGGTGLVLNEYLAGICLRYVATHGHDDEEHVDDELPAPNDL